MSGIFISGTGAVSPAGWGSEKLLGVLRDGELPAPQRIERPGWTRTLPVRRVPAPNPRPPWLMHARMRRTGAISQFVMGAAAEALASQSAGPLGIVFCTTCGCVSYSRRFYDEVLHDPAVASPLLFPETVFNAPASHLSAVLGTTMANYTLVGDSGVFLHGVALAANWLTDGRVTRCLVVAAEEADWISADAVRLFRKSVPLAEGAGAVLLTREPLASSLCEVELVTDPEPFATRAGRKGWTAALQRVNEALPSGPAAGADVARLGESFSAGAAWQTLAALDTARRGKLPRAIVRVPGAYQEAIGASFKMVPAAT